jgi:DNA polymerase (family 10)
MRLSLALTIAEAIKATLSPYCVRCEIAGSVRRKKADVGDLEIVCVPRPADILQFVPEVQNLGTTIKGDANGKYTQIALPQGIDLDLFITRPEQWGLIFAIRTGSSNFSHKTLATGWVKHGYHSVDGMLCKGGRPVAVREEKDLFAIIGIPYIEPEWRI